MLAGISEELGEAELEEGRRQEEEEERLAPELLWLRTEWTSRALRHQLRSLGQSRAAELVATRPPSVLRRRYWRLG